MLISDASRCALCRCTDPGATQRFTALTAARDAVLAEVKGEPAPGSAKPIFEDEEELTPAQKKEAEARRRREEKEATAKAQVGAG